MNKKGDSGEFALWIPRVLITLFIVGAIVTVLNSSIKKNLDLEELRFYPVAERILYSPDCFALKESSRPSPGIIDPKEFSNETIASCLKPILQNSPLTAESLTGLKPSIGAKVSLYYNQKTSSVFLNKEFFEDILPLTFSNQYLSYERRYFVLVKEENNLLPGNILIEVAWRK